MVGLRVTMGQHELKRQFESQSARGCNFMNKSGLLDLPGVWNRIGCPVSLEGVRE